MTLRLERAFTARADDLEPVARAIVDVAALDEGDDLDEVVAAAAILCGADVGPDDVRPAVALGLLAVAGPTYAARAGHGGHSASASTTARAKSAGASCGTLCPMPRNVRWSYGPVKYDRYIEPSPGGVNGSSSPSIVIVGTPMVGIAASRRSSPSYLESPCASPSRHR